MGISLEELIVAIEVKSNADQVLTSTQKKVVDLGKEFDRTDDKSKKLGKGVDSLGTSSGGLQTRLGGLLSSINPVTVGIGALTVGIGGAVAIIKRAIDDTVEYGSELNDLSLKLGVSVETLSGLNLQLEQSGTDLDTFGRGVFNLQKNLDEAANGNKELKRTFADLGIKDADAALQDTDQTVRVLFKSLGKLKSEGERNVAGAKVMGKSYQELSVFLADTNGDIDGTIERAKKLGATMTTEGAQGADAFGDALDTVKAQLRGAGNVMVSEFLPTMTGALDDLSAYLAQNQNSWKEWGDSIASHLETVLTIIKALNEAEEKTKNEPAWVLKYGGAFMESFDRITDENARKAEFDKDHPWTDIPLPRSGGGGRRRGGGSKTNTAEQNELKQLSIFNREVEAVTRQHREILEREYDLGIVSLDEYVEQAKAENESHFNNQLRAFAREEQIARTHTKNAEALRLKLAEIGLDRADALDARNKERQRIEDEANRARAFSSLSLEKQLAATQESVRKGMLDKLEAFAEAGLTTQTEYEKRRAALAEEAFNDQKILLELELKQFGTTLDRKVEIGNALIKLDRDRANAAEDASRRIITAMQAEHGVLPDPSGLADARNKVYQNQLPIVVDSTDPLPPVRTKWQKIGDFIHERSSEIAADFTGIFDRSLDELFENGFTSFFESILQGWADMLRQMALDFIQSQINQLLTNLAADLIGGIIKGAAGGFSGGAGGGAASGGAGMGSMLGFAEGGRPPVGVPSIVGERGKELFIPDQPGTIIPHHEMGNYINQSNGGGRTLNIHGGINFSFPHVRDARQAKQTEAQMARALMGLLQKNFDLG